MRQMIFTRLRIASEKFSSVHTVLVSRCTRARTSLEALSLSPFLETLNRVTESWHGRLIFNGNETGCGACLLDAMLSLHGFRDFREIRHKYFRSTLPDNVTNSFIAANTIERITSFFISSRDSSRLQMNEKMSDVTHLSFRNSSYLYIFYDLPFQSQKCSSIIVNS